MSTNHVVDLGKLVGNLQSLELSLRHYLFHAERGSAPLDPGAGSFWDAPIGSLVVENAFTNFDSLGILVRKYNARVATSRPDLAVGDDVVGLRDLIAHGRVAAPVADTAKLQIAKFGRPVDGKVPIEASALMDDAWFKLKINHVMEQVMKVSTATAMLPNLRL